MDKQILMEWQAYQTIAPDHLTVVSVGDRTAWLSWDTPIVSYYPGGYEVFSSLSAWVPHFALLHCGRVLSQATESVGRLAPLSVAKV
jgi:hypothetical protein